MGYMRGKLQRLVGRLLLALLLFTQFALVAQPCTLAEPAPQKAFAAETPCAMPGMAAHDTDSPNACLLHCTSGYQALDLHHLPPAAPMALASPLILSLAAVAPVVRSYEPVLLARVVDPPLSILFRNFRN